jgi:glucokinase
VIHLAYQYLADHRYPTEMESGNEFNVATILDAAHRGDSLAQAVFSQAGSWLGAAMSICIAITNPAMLVIGGGLGLAAYDLLVPTARIELERRVTPLTLAGLNIAPSCLTSSAVGAACLVWYSNSFK